VQLTAPPTPPRGWRRLLYRLPIGLYRARLGWLLRGRLVLVRHVGRRSGRTHETVLEVVQLETDGTVVVASGFGPRSDWYLNLLARPRAETCLGSRSRRVRAEPLTEAEAGMAMTGYARRHPRSARELCRFMGMRVDGSVADFREAGRRIPMLRLQPTT
jgi:deazaflavin-dependent oxidoreductase (nitroreductase family)